ncbi:MAG: hypothetical protein H0X01_05790, partial [Nitrospira sp.]|nr:hypothetical protein [Nitrospira sp.]
MNYPEAWPCPFTEHLLGVTMNAIKEAQKVRSRLAPVLLLGLLASFAGCGSDSNTTPAGMGSDGPDASEMPVVHQTGNAVAGQTVFRFETFGNERFWTDALRLQQGMMATQMTPLMALQRLGLSIDIDALDATTRQTLVAESMTNLSPQSAPMLNDPNTLINLINANAVIGIPAKDSNRDGIVNIRNGDKTGTTCALCHTITDASVLNMPNGGSIGRRQDGRAPHNLNFGALVATALNSRAYYPVLQLTLNANGGRTLGHAPTGIRPTSTEAEVDAYLSNPEFYPVGMFEDTFDGNGDPMHNMPLFRTDLAAPWGSDGTIARLDNFNNLVYTGLLDPTTVTTPDGRAFLRMLGGTAAGDEIADGYVQVLAATGVTGFPFL